MLEDTSNPTSPQYKNKPPREPSYICACRGGKWTVVTWDRARPDVKMFRKFKCRSWRHEGDCRRWKNAQDFARIHAAIESRESANFVYVVLTFKPSHWNNHKQAYKGILQCWDKLRKRLMREYGKIEYVNIIEQHKSGYPHLNLLIYNQDLASLCSGDGWKSVRRRWLEPNAVAAGFGWRTWIEPMMDAGAMAGYFAKIADGEASTITGEVSKVSQVPIVAPKNFRRLRASRGFLPRTHSNDRFTGELVQAKIESLRDAQQVTQEDVKNAVLS